MILFDISPLGGGIALGLAVSFVLICGLIAFIAFRLLKKTVKMAVRMIIVAVILLVALIGGIGLIWLGSGSPSKTTRPPVKTTR